MDFDWDLYQGSHRTGASSYNREEILKLISDENVARFLSLISKMSHSTYITYSRNVLMLQSEIPQYLPAEAFLADVCRCFVEQVFLVEGVCRPTNLEPAMTALRRYFSMLAADDIIRKDDKTDIYQILHDERNGWIDLSFKIFESWKQHRQEAEEERARKLRESYAENWKNFSKIRNKQYMKVLLKSGSWKES